MRDAQDPAGGTHGPGSEGGRGAGVLEGLRAVRATLGSLGPALAPERVSQQQVNEVVAELAAIEKQVRGAKLVLRKAAADTGAWRASGARSAAEHMAKQEGISVGQAKGELDASAKLTKLPKAREATGSGDISVEKAKAIAAAGAADPSAEDALVETARTGDLRDTQDEARRTIVRADEGSGEQARRVHQRRSLRTWLSVDGEGHGVWNIPADAHHRFMAALEPYRRQAFRDARANGQRLPDEALMADALDMLSRDILLDLAEEQAASADPPAADPGGAAAPEGDEPTPFAADAQPAGTPPTATIDPDAQPTARSEERAPKPSSAPGATARTSSLRRRHRRAPAQIMVVVDFDALRRGFAADEETCEITGLGPVPVGLVQHMMQDALLRLVVQGTDVTLISSQRRYVPADLRAALWARDKGTCVVPGCHATRGLEIDHCHVDFAADGPTALWNSALLCKVHHMLKTLCGWLLGGSHEEGWTFTPPEPERGPPCGPMRSSGGDRATHAIVVPCVRSQPRSQAVRRARQAAYL